MPRILRGANASKLSNLNPTNKRRDLVLLSALIEYPGLGLILYETGCAEDLEVVISPPSYAFVIPPNRSIAMAGTRDRCFSPG